MATATIVTPEMIATLNQTAPRLIQMSSRLEIDGVDVTSRCSSFRVTHRNSCTGTDAEFQMLGSPGDVTITLRQSVVALFISYTTQSGDTFEAERFRGTAHLIEEARTSEASAWSITCYDAGYKLAEVPVQQWSRAARTWSGSALDELNGELAANGFGPAYGEMADWTGVSFQRWGFANARDYINILADYYKRSVKYMGPDGILRIKAYDESAAGPWAFPLTAQTDQTPIDDSAARCNRVCIGGIGLWRSFSPYSEWTAEDTADQATRGILQKNLWPASPGSYAAITTAMATAYMEWSQLQRYSWGSPLQAFVFPGEVVTLTLVGGSTAAVMVEEVTDAGGFPEGFWSSWVGRAVP